MPQGVGSLEHGLEVVEDVFEFVEPEDHEHEEVKEKPKLNSKPCVTSFNLVEFLGHLEIYSR